MYPLKKTKQNRTQVIGPKKKKEKKKEIGKKGSQTSTLNGHIINITSVSSESKT